METSASSCLPSTSKFDSVPSVKVNVNQSVKMRKFMKVPIFIVENHNDVLELLLPSMANGYLPFQSNFMVHFDSHPDMCVPRSMPSNTIYQRNVLLESLSIENWLIPLMYGGHFNEIAWVRPPWARQIPDGHHMFSVGDYNNKIHVSSSLDYFLSDGCYQTENLLVNKKQVSIHVTEINEKLSELIVDDDRQWVLDIDLDYFSTLNPFLNIYPKAGTYDKLRKIFKVDKVCDINDPASVTAFAEERNRELDFFESVFQHMAQCGSLDNFKCRTASLKNKFELVKELIECLCHHYSIYEIDWFIVNDAGCTTDDKEFELPNHESTDDEIKLMVKHLEIFLKSFKKPPAIITIARSCDDGYTPNHQIESIQSKVIDVLRKVYNEIIAEQPTLWYKNSSQIPALQLTEPRRPSKCSS